MKAPPFAMIPSRVAATPLNGCALRVLVAIAMRAAGKDATAWPSLARIAEDTGLDRRHIPRALRQLESAGLIVRAHRQQGEGRGLASNLYEIVRENNGVSPKMATGGDTKNGDRVSPKMATGVAKNGDKVSSKLVSEGVAKFGALTDNFYEQNREQNHETDSPNRTRASARLDVDESDFACWWELYPIKRNKSKARLAYAEALKETSVEFLLEALAAYINDLAGTDTNFAYPANWLSDKRWEDQLDYPSPMEMGPPVPIAEIEEIGHQRRAICSADFEAVNGDPRMDEDCDRPLAKIALGGSTS